MATKTSNTPEGAPVSFAPEEYPKSGRYTNCAVMVLAPNASSMSHTGTNTWILSEPEGETCVIVDPGPDDQGHLDNLVRYCLALGATPVAILLTHEHTDHCYGAEPLATMLGIPILSKRRGNLNPGPLQIRDFDLELETIDLPGHSSDCVGFLIPQDNALVTGDVIFDWGSTVIAPDGGSLKDFFDTYDELERLVTEEGVGIFLAAHGHVIDDPLPLIKKYREHRRARLASVKQATDDLDLASTVLDPACFDLDESLLDILNFEGFAACEPESEKWEAVRLALMQDPTIDRIFRQAYQDAPPALEYPAKRNIQVQLQYLRHCE